MNAEIYKCYFDGATYPKNPGIMGIGFLIVDPTGKTIFEQGLELEYGTNNEAEYRALNALMIKLNKMNISAAEIYGDSQLVISQSLGEWKVNAQNLKTLNLEARKLYLKVPGWKLKWIARDKNTAADKLSKKPFQKEKPAKKIAGSKTTKSSGKEIVVKHVCDALWVAMGSTDLYIVDIENNTCECKDFQIRGKKRGTCKHLDACNKINDEESNVPF